MSRFWLASGRRQPCREEWNLGLPLPTNFHAAVGWELYRSENQGNMQVPSNDRLCLAVWCYPDGDLGKIVPSRRTLRR